jgi:predicted nucleic acid-binding protein
VDLAILGTAIAGRCDLLISVDKDLLEIGVFREVVIVKPGEFWRRVRAEGQKS